MEEIDRLNAFGEIMEKAIIDAAQSAARDTTKTLAERVRTEHTWVVRTGKTLEEIGDTYRDIQAGGEGTIQIEGNASRLHEGTKPHEIRPKLAEIGPLRPSQSRRGKGDVGTHRTALRWTGDGATHFAAVVHHPGTAPDPYFDKAADAALDTLEEKLDAALERFFG